MWITEWGCYADDDPPCVPPVVGESPLYVTGDSAEEISAVFGDGENQSSK